MLPGAGQAAHGHRGNVHDQARNRREGRRPGYFILTGPGGRLRPSLGPGPRPRGLSELNGHGLKGRRPSRRLRHQEGRRQQQRASADAAKPSPRVCALLARCPNCFSHGSFMHLAVCTWVVVRRALCWRSRRAGGACAACCAPQWRKACAVPVCREGVTCTWHKVCCTSVGSVMAWRCPASRQSAPCQWPHF